MSLPKHRRREASNFPLQVGYNPLSHQGVSAPLDSDYVAVINLSGGTLTSSNMYMTDGSDINQTGGALVVTNSLTFDGFIQPGPQLFSTYTLSGGTLTASNISVGGTWNIGDGIVNQISNPGLFTLSRTLMIGNSVVQLGHFILGTNATINLAGSTSQLSFANSSSQTWEADATLVIMNWNGNPAGGGAEQLKFGTDQTGLTSGQLNQIQFSIGTNLYSARILSTGEVVPNQAVQATIAFSQQGNNLVLTWPAGWTLQSATNVVGPYSDVANATSPYTNDMSQPQQYFRLRQ